MTAMRSFYHIFAAHESEIGCSRRTIYDWPGNVRDLEHTVERLVVIGDQPEITGEDVEMAIHGERVSPVKETGNLQNMLDAYERTILENAVKNYGSSRKIAEALGVSQPTVLRKLKRLHIQLKNNE